MNMKQNWKKALVSGAVAFTVTAGALMAVATLPQVASAQDSGTPAPTAPADKGRENFGRGGMRGPEGMKGPGGPQDEALAEQLGITVEALEAAHEAAHSSEGDPRESFAQELGITVDELDAAMQAVRESQFQEALESGQVTQEQYDLIQAREALKTYVDRETLTAQVLGITVEELQAYRDAGTRMDEIFTELGVDAETFRTNMEAAMDAALQTAVDDGVISADQATQIQEGPGPGAGGPGGRGGDHGPGRGVRPGAPPADAPAAPEDNSNL